MGSCSAGLVSAGLDSAGLGAKKFGTGGGAAAAGADGFAKKLGIEEPLDGMDETGAALVDGVPEEGLAGAAKENVEGVVFGASVDRAGDGCVVPAVLVFEGSVVAGLLVEGAAKLNADEAAGVGFSEVLVAGAVGTALNNGGAGTLDGVALGIPEERVPVCLSRIFDMACASRSCFSHLEYDIVFCIIGLSDAGEAGCVWMAEIRRVVTVGWGLDSTFDVIDCLNGPLLKGLSRGDEVDDHNRFFPETFDGDSYRCE